MKHYQTAKAAQANPNDVAYIENESMTCKLAIHSDELEDYEAYSGFGIEDVTPDWLLFDMLIWCKDTQLIRKP